MIRPALAALFAASLLGAPAFAQDVERPQGPEVPQDLRLYSEASLQMHRRNYAEALKTFERLIQKHPQSQMKVPATFWRGQCLEDLGRTQEAKAAYTQLVEAHAGSGWAEDAQRRLAAMTVKAPVTVDLSQARAGKRTLVLANGDVLSGRVLDAKEDEVVVEAEGVGTLTMPRERIARIRADRTIEIHDDNEEVDVVVGPDGTKTTTTVHPDGSKTVTVVRTQKDGKRVVEVRRSSKAGGDQDERHIELLLDDEEEVEEHLRKLPGKVKMRIKKKLGDLEGLEDLDLHLEGLEGLEDLPKKLRIKIGKSLEGLHGKHKDGPRYLFLHDEEEEHHGHHGPRRTKRIEVFKDHAKAWKDSAKHWRDYTKGWAHGDHGRTKTLWSDDRGNTYTFFGEDGNVFHHRGGDHSTAAFHLGGNTKDRVHLRNGDKISGTLQGVDGKHVRMKTEYGEVKIDRDQVRQILFATPQKPFLGLVGGSETDKGWKVEGVAPGSAAERAGLKAGDVIVYLNGMNVSSMQDVSKQLKGKKVGDTVRMTVRRGDKKLELKAKLGKKPHSLSFALPARPMTPARPMAPRAPRPPMPPRPPRRATPVRPAPPAPRVRKRVEKRVQKQSQKQTGGKPFLGISCDAADNGVKIARVLDGSVLEGTAKAGDVITHFKGKKVEGVDQLIQAVRACKVGEQFSVRIERGEGQVLELVLKMGARPGEAKAEAPEAPSAPKRSRQLRQY